MPGGKIEDGELPEEAAIREIKEETGIDANNPIHKGKLVVDAPMRQYELDVFVVYEVNGDPEETEENTSEWLEINDLLRKDKKFSNIMLLDAQLIDNLIHEEKSINLLIEIDDDENILSIKKRG
jgi:mutator protein MutT